MVANLLRLPCIRRQRGFTLIELAVVSVIVTAIAVLAVPQIRNYVIDARAAGVARDIETAALRVMQTREGLSPMNAGFTLAEFGAALRATGATSVTLTPATGTVTAITHRLASGTEGNVSAGPNDGALVIGINWVSPAACVRLVQLLAPKTDGLAWVNTAGGTWTWPKPRGGTLDSAAVSAGCDVDRHIHLYYMQ